MKPSQRSLILSKKLQPCQGGVVVEVVAEEAVEVAETRTGIKIKTIVMEAAAVPDGTSQTKIRGADLAVVGVLAILICLQNKPVNYIGNSGKVLISVWIPPPVPGRMSSPPSPDPTNEVPTSSTAILFQTRCIIHSLIQKYIHLC